MAFALSHHQVNIEMDAFFEESHDPVFSAHVLGMANVRNTFALKQNRQTFLKDS